MRIAQKTLPHGEAYAGRGYNRREFIRSDDMHRTAPHPTPPRHVAQRPTPAPRRCRISYRAGAILHELSAGEGDTELAVIPAEDLVDRQDRVQLVPR